MFSLLSKALILTMLLMLVKSYELKCGTGNLRGNYEYDSFREHGGYRDSYDDKGEYSCKSPSENTRGQYSTKLKPCVFAFHKATEKKDEDADSSFRTSTICSDTNRINKDTIQEYVSYWPDECVGDFQRCYSVEKDERIFIEFFCSKPHWKIPKETTHISVSCVDDKQAKIFVRTNHTDEYEDRFEKRQQEQYLEKMKQETAHMKHLEMIAVISFVLTFGACLIIIKVIYSNLLRPYYHSITPHDD